MRAFLRGFRYAFEGIAYVWQTQRNAWVHTLVAAIIIAAGLYFQVSSTEWAVIFLAMGVVFGAETFNTVVELTVDLAVQHYDPMAKHAKDAAAGAVLLTAIASVAVGAAIFGPRLWALVFGQ